jgi:hypothetical protein
VRCKRVEVVTMLEAKKPWLSIYGDRLSGEPLGGSLTEFLEEAVEKYRDNTALTLTASFWI